MTTELEQEFFKVFGIEPIEYRKNVPCLNFLSSGICNITDERCNPSKCNDYKPDKTHKNWRDFMEVYPEITAEKLLRMEDILLRKHIQIEYCFYNGNYYSSCTIALCNGKSDNKKDAFLEMLISIAQNFLDNCDTDGEEEIYKQIQQLFKEGE